MPSVLCNYVRLMDSFTMRLGRVWRFTIFALMGVLLIEAGARNTVHTFHVTTIWSVETAIFIYGAYFIVGGGFTLLTGGHVKMDILYSRWSPRRRAITDAALFFLFVIYIGIVLWACTKHAIISTAMRQHSGSSWGPPLYPIKIILVVGAIFMLLQGISEFIKHIAIARGKPLP